jgi:hypothetical protein
MLDRGFYAKASQGNIGSDWYVWEHSPIRRLAQVWLGLVIGELTALARLNHITWVSDW